MTTRLQLAVGLSVACVAYSASGQCEPSQASKLVASDGTTQDYFGLRVAIDGTTAVVGAMYDDERATDAGAVYTFERIGDAWIETAKLTASDAGQGHAFGASVSISDNTALVGAQVNGSMGGAVYVLDKVGGTWTESARLAAIDGQLGDGFGVAVCISDDTAVIGASGGDDPVQNGGSAYVFERRGGAWMQVDKLVPFDVAPGDAFGRSVSVSDGVLVVGSMDDNQRGAAYVFEQIEGEWLEVAKLVASDGLGLDRFGWSVSLSGGTAVIGAPEHDGACQYCGAVYVFENTGGAWTEVAKLTASDGSRGLELGMSVSISEATILAGAVGKGGSSYVFERLGGGWAEVAKLEAADGDPFDGFGGSVGASGYTALVGAAQDDDSGTDSGSVYVFDLCEPCRADLTGDGVVDTRDVLQFLGAWVLKDPSADWNRDGTINTLDFLAFLNDWAAGC